VKTLDKVVREYLVEAGDTNLNRYARMLQISISGLRELNMDVSGAPKAVVIPVNDNDTVNLPDDYVDYLKIAICDGRTGNIRSLGYNPQMCLPIKTDNCGNPSNASSGASSGASSLTGAFWADGGGSVNRDGEFLGRMFGIGGGTNRNGYYRLDEPNGLIVLQGVSGGEIYLEYLADLDFANGEHRVDEKEIEALKAWVYWKDIQRNRTYNLGQVREAKTEWVRNKNLTRRRFQTFTMEEALQSIRKTVKLAPKT